MDKPSVKKGIGTVVIVMLLILVPLFSLLVLNASYEALYLFLVGLVISAILVLGFFVYYSFYYRWARWCMGVIGVFLLWILVVICLDDIKKAYSDWSIPDKYARYKILEYETSYREQGKEIQFLMEDDVYNYYFLNAKNELVCFDHYLGAMYKYDIGGKMIDKFVSEKLENHTREGFFLNHYFVNTIRNFYTSWAIDGDTLMKPITFVEGSDKWSAKQRLEHLSIVKEKAECYVLKEIIVYDHDVSAALNKDKLGAKVVYRQDQKWQFFYLSTDSFGDLSVYSLREKGLEKGWNDNLFNDIMDTGQKTESHKRGMIRPQYISYDGENQYYDLVIDNVTFRLKNTPYYYDKGNREVFMQNETIYRKDKEASTESLGDYEVYQNVHLYYKLLTNSNKLYIIK